MGYENSDLLAPQAWLNFKKFGRDGIVPLVAPKTSIIPSRYDQLQMNEEGKDCLKIIRNFYKDNPYGFEACATELMSKIDSNFVDFNLTRPWRDGGRDAIGHYAIGVRGHNPNPLLKIDCALEAKCYAEDHSVGVREISRLISRIRYRQFGILVTTSFVGEQAYREVVEDGHPILVVSATNIASTLRQNHLDSSSLYNWLETLEAKYPRLS